MPEITIHPIDPENIAFLPKVFTDFLYLAVKKSPASDLTVEDALAYTRIGAGDICIIRMDKEPVGACFYLYGKGRDGLILDVALLGGKQFSHWKGNIRAHAIETAKAKGCNQIWIMGREGWGKMFPDMEEIGRVYCLKVGEG